MLKVASLFDCEVVEYVGDHVDFGLILEEGAHLHEDELQGKLPSKLALLS
jgi:hypothetical protein